MSGFQEEREKIAVQLAEAREEEARLTVAADRLAGDLTRARARIASLAAEDHTYAMAIQNRVPSASSGDLSHLTIPKAILTVLGEVSPESLQVHELERRMAARGKKVSSGVSVDLTFLKSSGKVSNPARGYWAVP
jgi:hypothetical protein